MSADGSFMHFNGRRVEWEQLHPAFQSMFAFGIHGPEVCLDLNIHPMFPTTAEIETVGRTIRELEEALV
jgi:hypothetical protein